MPRRSARRQISDGSTSTVAPVANRSATFAERGATLAEYALLVALVAVVAIGALRLLGDRSEEAFDAAAEATAGSAEATPPAGGDGPGGGGPGSGGPGSGGPGGGGGGATTTTTLPDPEGGGDDSPPTTEQPEEPGGSTKIEATGTRHGDKWSSTATFTLYGVDGKPLTPRNAGLQFVVYWTYSDWNGKVHTVRYTSGEPRIDPNTGQVKVDLNGFGTDRGHNVLSVRYEVVNVRFYDPHPVAWDGEAPAFTVLQPPPR